MFRPGSISKLFIWTAVMQLVEQGKIDLDQDINKYLDFHVPCNIRGYKDTLPRETITIKHLLNYTAGFEDQFSYLKGD
jgi:CubicO group peptidase (beta-lactamase class C family)